MADMTFLIEGKEHAIDDFELGELEWLESELNANLSDARAMSSMKAAVRIVYLVKRRTDPEFTLEDARKIKLSVFDGDEEESPEAVPPSKPPAKREPKATA